MAATAAQPMVLSQRVRELAPFLQFGLVGHAYRQAQIHQLKYTTIKSIKTDHD